MIKKIAITGLAAIALATSLLAMSAPASADWYYHRRHSNWGPYAAGALGALAVGAIAASAYDSCYYDSRPIFDRWGNVIGYRRVPMC